MKKACLRISMCVVVFLLLGVASAEIITVDDNGPADYNSIQVAIDNSSNGDIVEVQPGTYYENINFYGRAITVTGSNINDMGIIYGTVIDGGMIANTVTFDSGENINSKLQALTVENGGRGIYCYYSDPTIIKCVVRYSQDSSTSGAGIRGVSASPTIEECIVRENGYHGISHCGGLIKNCMIQENAKYGIQFSDGLILGCTVSENRDHGMYACDGEIKDCDISGNSGHGLSSCDGQIRNCVIQGNTSHGLSSCQDGEVLNCTISGNGGHGLYDFSGQLKNCTIVGNKQSGVEFYSHSSTLANNIIAKNGAYGLTSGSPVLKYNNIWGNTLGNYSSVVPGGTDTHSNPLFAVDGFWDNDTWIEGEYYLKSLAGRWTDSGWTNDAVTSPCIDAGDPIGGYLTEPMPHGDRINQGAYGGTVYASKSPYSPEGYCGNHIPYDTNDDCRIDMTDFAEWATYWLECNLVPQSACLE